MASSRVRLTGGAAGTTMMLFRALDPMQLAICILGAAFFVGLSVVF